MNNNQSVDVKVTKKFKNWKTKNGYNHDIQSGFGRFKKKFNAPIGTHYLYLLYML
jgi:CRISPR/Cas system-associated protein Csx1